MRDRRHPMVIPDNAALEGAPAQRSGGRRASIDIARGLAVVGMVIFHTAWDLSQLDLIETDIAAAPDWSLFARIIAASFLGLSGIGLVLAHGERVRRDAFLKRFAVIAVAALTVSVVTRFVFPDSYIFFGVLHNIAASSLVAILFVRAPAPLTAAAAAAVLGLPLVVTAATFNEPWLAFVGLGSRVPVTNDYVPLFPWTGFVLAGVAAGRLAYQWLRRPVPEPVPSVRAGRWLSAIGRRSLLIYLIHQPLIFGALSGVRELTGPNLAAEAAPFMANCTASCGAAGQEAPVCRASCGCTVDGLRREGSWKPLITGGATPDQTARASEIARACLDASRIPAPRP